MHPRSSNGRENPENVLIYPTFPNISVEIEITVSPPTPLFHFLSSVTVIQDILHPTTWLKRSVSYLRAGS